MSGIDQGAFDQLLNRIRSKEHPDYGSMSFNGVDREFEMSVSFQRPGMHEDDEIIRGRALRFLESLTPEERDTVNLDIIMQKGSPVRAVIKGNTKDLDPERLKALQRSTGL